MVDTTTAVATPTSPDGPDTTTQNRARSKRWAARSNVLGLVVLACLFGLWELVVRASLISYDYLPPPTDAVGGMVEMARNGDLAANTGHTLTVTLLGWAIAAAVGLVLGAAVGLLPRLRAGSMASLEALRAVPIVAFVPVSVLLFGFTTEMEVAVAAYAALWPVLINTIAGMQAVSTRMLEVGRVLRLSRFEVLWKLRLPAAVPLIVVGLRLAMAMSLILTLVAEMIGNPDGIGSAMIRAGQSLHPDHMFAYIIVVGMLGTGLNAVLVAATRAAFKGPMGAAADAR